MSIDEEIYKNKPASSNISELLSTLSTQSKLVLFSILLQNKKNNQTATIKTITLNEVYDLYIEFCNVTKNKCLCKRKVNDLILYDLKGLLN